MLKYLVVAILLVAVCSAKPSKDKNVGKDKDKDVGKDKDKDVVSVEEDQDVVDVPIFTGDECVEDCSANTRFFGRYQRCDRCDAYFICFRKWGPFKRSCRSGLFFDADAKRCVPSSTTCDSEPLEAAEPGLF